jgi:hypothetical protein
MSYNVAICTPPVPADDAAAWEGIDSLIKAQGDPPPVFRELHDLLTARYPVSALCPTKELIKMVFGAMDLYGATSGTASQFSA